MDRFERMQSLPLYWLNSAEDLGRAAEVLWRARESHFSGPYQLMAGLALELLFKAILVAKRRPPPTIHDLERLSEVAGVAYTPDQAGLLRILSHAIRWYGRYPVPKDREVYEEHMELIDAHLWTREPHGESAFSFSKPNHRLSWESYRELWNVGFEEYARHHRTQA